VFFPGKKWTIFELKKVKNSGGEILRFTSHKERDREIEINRTFSRARLSPTPPITENEESEREERVLLAALESLFSRSRVFHLCSRDFALVPAKEENERDRRRRRAWKRDIKKSEKEKKRNARSVFFSREDFSGAVWRFLAFLSTENACKSTRR
jgi:hypothetical protein